MDAKNQSLNIEDVHWHLGLLQNLDVGLTVVDSSYNVQLWNSFMSNHSGIGTYQIRGHNLFDVVDSLPDQWLRSKLDMVFELKSPFYISWEQRPFLFRFKSQRPITGDAPFMYQNITLIPLTSPSGEVENVGILVYDVTEMAISKLALQEANSQLQGLSRIDRLTGLYNRGYWEECLELELNRFMRNQSPSTLIMIDIDHFKNVNDTYGHPVGDEVIRRIADLLSLHARKTDVVGRYGGEEFGVILTGTTADQSEVVAERLRRAAELMEIEHEGGVFSITISLGIAEIQPEVERHEQWVSHADQALYYSKQNGRNQYSFYSVI